MAAALLVVAGGAWYAMGAKKSDAEVVTKRVAVVPFENPTGDASLDVVGRVASEEFSRSIAQADSADVVAGEAVAAAAGKRGTVSYSKSGDSLRMQLSVIDAHGQGDARARSNDGASARSDDRDFGTTRAVAGLDQKASRARFERAIQLDSSFVAAYAWLAITHMNAAQYATADSTVAPLRRQRDRLAAVGRLQLDLIEAQLRDDVPEIVRLSQELDRRTGEPLFAYQAGFYALTQLRPKLTLPVAQRFDSAQLAELAGLVLRAQATAYHLLGDHANEIAALDRGIKLRPTLATAFSGQKLRAFAALHDSARAWALADSLLQREARGSATAVIYMRAAATPSIAWERTIGDTFLAAGQLDSAETHYKRAQPDSSIPNALARIGRLAIVAALRGDTLRARIVSDSLGANTPKWDQALTVYWQAAIAAYLGKRDEAVRFLKSKNPYPQSMVSWHSDFELRPLRGYPPFEALITPQR